MKKNTLILFGLILWLAAFGAGRASAQIYATDTAAAYNTWTNGENFGTGFEPWILTVTNNGDTFGGFVIQSSGNGDGNSGAYVDTSGKAFSMFANGPGTPYAIAYRGMSNALAADELFEVRFQNNNIQQNGTMGFCLRTDDNTNFTDASIIADPDTQFAFYFVGGNSDYYIYDANGASDSGVGFTTQGLLLQFYLLATNTYELVISTADGSTVLNTLPISPLPTGSPITTFAGFALQCGPFQDAFFNNLEVASVTTIPPTISNLSPTNTEVYVGAGAQLSFDVTSMFSDINSSSVSLILNGVNETNQMSFVGSGTTNLQVTLNPPLQANVLYNGSIKATDVNGNPVSSHFSFNTWSDEYTNIYIEASDYNYSGGEWIDNFLNAEPNVDYGPPEYGGYGLNGTQGIDYYVYDLQETNIPEGNAFRPPDYPYLEPTTDVDHDAFNDPANDFTAYDLGFNEYGQWEDYTRELSNNVTYAVYARMAGFGSGGVMSLERMAAQEVSTTNQPGVSLGQFNCPYTGGISNWTFVPLTDFMSSNVLVNFPVNTNTFRITDIGISQTYNVTYLVLVALTNNSPLRPYLTSGFPYPGAEGVNPEQPISFTIANRKTTVNSSSIKFFLNSSNVTSGIVINSNLAGTVVSYQPVYPNLLPPGTDTEEVIFSDGTVSQTDSWQYIVETLSNLPTAWALPLTGSYARGISEQIAKAPDSSSSADFPPNLTRAEAQLAGTLTNSTTEQLYTNSALNGGNYIESNTINYALSSTYIGLFNPTNPFPDTPVGGSNDVAMAANMYVYLTPGVYNFDVYSDDGFQFSAGPAPTSTNMILGAFNGGRPPSGTEFSFIVQTNGLYPMQLIYFKAQTGGGGVELYSINETNGASVLLNDTNTAGSVAVYYQTVSAAPKLSISTSGNNVVLSWTDPTYSLQSAPVVTGPYTTINGATSPHPYAISGAQEYFRLAK